MAAVTIQHLTKMFGNQPAVLDLSLEIFDKELVVIVGPSGCGKTTTLNCIAGLETPTCGEILFDGRVVTHDPPHLRNIAMVFQSSLLYPHLTGRENIRMSLVKSKLSKEEIEQRINEAAVIVGAQEVIDKQPAQMSGGERQRIAIAKAIVRKPDVFLMDEPLANLDAAIRELLRSEISVLQKRIGTTMILVTHDQVEAMTMADRIVVMSDGMIQQVGTPDEVYNHPANTFVAQFIGSPSMQMFPGEISMQEGKLVFQNSRFSLALPDAHAKALGEPRLKHQVILGIRPHHMYLSHEALPSGFPASVYAIEQMGREAIVILSLEGGEKIKVTTSAQIDYQRGETMWVGIHEEHTKLFDPDTKKNLLV